MNKQTALRTLKMQLTTQEIEMANYLEELGYGA
jgi:hypothetical protein